MITVKEEYVLLGVDRLPVSCEKPCIDRKQQVIAFLVEIKKIMSNKNSFQLIDRHKNLKTIAALGYTIDDVRMELFELTVCNYVKEPEPDRDPRYSGEFWFFGTTIDDTNLYIKLKITNTGSKSVLCLSFHEEKWPQRFPFKE